MLNLHPSTAGTLAQLVEQRTENPCVPGSIPGGTTFKNLEKIKLYWVFFLCFLFWYISPKKEVERKFNS